MKYLFVVTDVHSYYDEMITALKKQKFDIDNENHIFVSCGDLLDRGPDPQKCLDFVNSIPDNRKILIMGNHEDLMEDAIKRGIFLSHDYHNRTLDTVSKVTGFSIDDILNSDFTCLAACTAMDTNRNYRDYTKKLRYFAEIGDYIFVHGWIPSYYKKCKDPYLDGQSINSTGRLNEDWKYYGDWKDAMWSNGMQKWSQGERLVDKTIVCGHFHTSWGHSHIHHKGVEFVEVWYETQENDPEMTEHFEPFEDEGIIALDGCTAYSGICNCIKLKVKESEWRSRT